MPWADNLLNTIIFLTWHKHRESHILGIRNQGCPSPTPAELERADDEAPRLMAGGLTGRPERLAITYPLCRACSSSSASLVGTGWLGPPWATRAKPCQALEHTGWTKTCRTACWTLLFTLGSLMVVTQTYTVALGRPLS